MKNYSTREYVWVIKSHYATFEIKSQIIIHSHVNRLINYFVLISWHFFNLVTAQEKKEIEDEHLERMTEEESKIWQKRKEKELAQKQKRRKSDKDNESSKPKRTKKWTLIEELLTYISISILRQNSKNSKIVKKNPVLHYSFNHPISYK